MVKILFQIFIQNKPQSLSNVEVKVRNFEKKKYLKIHNLIQIPG